MFRYWSVALTASVLAVTGCAPGNSPLAARPGAMAPIAERPMADVRFVISVPAPTTALKAAYVSPATKSVSISVNTGDPQIGNLGTAPSTVTITLRAPVGQNTFTARLYDTQNAGGNMLSTVQLPVTIVSGQENTVQLTPKGVPKRIALSVDRARVVKGSSTTVTLAVSAIDAGGYTIIGPLDTPITLSNSDGTGGVALANATVQSSGSETVTYNGANIPPVTLGAAATGVAPADVDPAVITPVTALPPNGGVVSTLAGHRATYYDGTGAMARFDNPIAITIDSSGNAFVADFQNNVIRKITPGGVTTTFAGNGIAGTADGVGTAAQLSGPAGVAFDSAGNLLVSDNNNHLIRKITPGGVVSTLAGSTTAGSLDGTGVGAQFNHPTGIVLDPSDNAYISDFANNRVRKVTPAGVVTTVAGSGTAGLINAVGTSAQLKNNGGIDIDAAGNIFVGEFGNNVVRKIDTGLNVTTFAGSIDGFLDGTGTGAQFHNVAGMQMDAAGNLFVADYGNNAIRKIDPGGVVTTFAGSTGATGTDDGTGASARFNQPYDLAFAADGSMLVADTTNGLIRKITTAGVVTTFAGSTGKFVDGTGLDALFSQPFGITIDGNGNVFVADTGNNAIRKIDPAGVVSTVAGQPAAGAVNGTGTAARFSNPTGLVATADGTLYVADPGNNAIRKIDPAGVVTLFAGGILGYAEGTGTAARFTSPYDLAFDSKGNLFVADVGNHRIRKITAAGVATTLAGNGVPGLVNGTGTGASFFNPIALAVNGSDDVFVVDYGNNVIRKVTPAGVVTTLAGSGAQGSANGTGSGATFRNPVGIEIDSNDNIYVSDYGNNMIRKVTLAGVVTTLAGQTGAGLLDGVGTSARFTTPTGITTDANGVLYVTDYGNSVVRKIQ